MVLAPNEFFFSLFWCTYYVITSIVVDVASGVDVVTVSIAVVVSVSPDVNDVVPTIDASVIASRVDAATFVVSGVGATSYGVDFVLVVDVVIVAAAFVASAIVAATLDANVDEHLVHANGDVDVAVVDVVDVVVGGGGVGGAGGAGGDGSVAAEIVVVAAGDVVVAVVVADVAASSVARIALCCWWCGYC